MSVFIKLNDIMRRGRVLGCSLAILAVSGLAGPVSAMSTLETVRERGHLICGVAGDEPGFSLSDDRGQWSGIDTDFCRALAVAALGAKDKVKFRPLTEADRVKALLAGEIDVLANPASWTLSRDTELGIRFAGILYFDGQGFLARRAEALTSVLELSGSSVCVQTGTSAEQGLTDYFRARQMRVQLVLADKWEDVVNAYATGGCTLMTGDLPLLALERSRLPSPADHMLLPELITKEPAGPAVRLGDEAWFALVRWTLMALVAAEELGLTSQNAESSIDARLADVRRFLGVEAHLGQSLGLAPDWALQIVKQIGNYGEIYDRSLGSRSPLKLERGLNNLWNKGGLMYAVPFR